MNAVASALSGANVPDAHAELIAARRAIAHTRAISRVRR